MLELLRSNSHMGGTSIGFYDKKDINKIISQILNKQNFKSYYWNYNVYNIDDESYIVIDYGSWSDFFIVKGQKDQLQSYMFK